MLQKRREKNIVLKNQDTHFNKIRKRGLSLNSRSSTLMEITMGKNSMRNLQESNGEYSAVNVASEPGTTTWQDIVTKCMVLITTC